MSDYWVEFMSLDADENEASDLFDAQINWLLGQEIIAPSAKPDRFYGTFRDGPRFADAMDPEWVEPGAVAEGRHILFGVRIKKGWQMSHNMGGSRVPRALGAAISSSTAASRVDSCSTGTSRGQNRP